MVCTDQREFAVPLWSRAALLFPPRNNGLMTRFVLLVLLTLANSVALAEPVSVRCTNPAVPQPYFVTFDVAAGRAVFESAGRYSGRITERPDGLLEISIKADSGNIELSFDRERSRAIWPGLSADPLRPLLVDGCASIPTRTLLALHHDLRDSALSPQSFSIRCEDLNQPYFFTFDVQAKKVVMESVPGARVYLGEIRNLADHRLAFLLGMEPRFDLVWDGSAKTITWQGVPGNPARPTKVNACSETAIRTMMELHGRF